MVSIIYIKFILFINLLYLYKYNLYSDQLYIRVYFASCPNIIAFCFLDDSNYLGGKMEPWHRFYFIYFVKERSGLSLVRWY